MEAIHLEAFVSPIARCAFLGFGVSKTGMAYAFQMQEAGICSSEWPDVVAIAFGMELEPFIVEQRIFDNLFVKDVLHLKRIFVGVEDGRDLPQNLLVVPDELHVVLNKAQQVIVARQSIIQSFIHQSVKAAVVAWSMPILSNNGKTGPGLPETAEIADQLRVVAAVVENEHITERTKFLKRPNGIVEVARAIIRNDATEQTHELYLSRGISDGFPAVQQGQRTVQTHQA
jgi:hypothetical protein